MQRWLLTPFPGTLPGYRRPWLRLSKVLPAMVMFLGLSTRTVGAQQADESHWSVYPIPLLGYDTDEGLEYGAIVDVSFYGPDAPPGPPSVTIRPSLQFSAEGRRDATVFIDAPRLPDGWRLTVFGGFQRHLATPYYGLGNESERDPALERSPNPYYYRYGRTRGEITFDLQAPVRDTPVRVLFGTGSAKIKIDPTPHDEGTTLVATQFESSPGGLPHGWTNFIRAGIIWDTRDSEVDPTRGVWSEALIKQAAESLAGDYSFTRWTLTDRRYYSLVNGLVLANRVVLQGTNGNVPFYELQSIDSSVGSEEALGGARSLRGIPKNRYAGRGLFLWNLEMRYHALSFSTGGHDFRIVASAFMDSGRVWAGALHLPDVFSDWHQGFGGGLRLGVGERFMGSLDIGHSTESEAPVYMGMGYLF